MNFIGTLGPSVVFLSARREERERVQGEGAVKAVTPGRRASGSAQRYTRIAGPPGVPHIRNCEM